MRIYLVNLPTDSLKILHDERGSDDPLFCQDFKDWVKDNNIRVHFFTRVSSDLTIPPHRNNIQEATWNDLGYVHEASLMFEKDDEAMLFKLSW